MPPREDFILFLDLETTGVEPGKDEIIEIGMSLVSTDEGYPEVDAYSHIITPTPKALDRLLNKKVVREMHMSNGLLTELNQSPMSYSVEEVEKDVLLWLDTHLRGDTTHIPYGGSGVLHFDRPFIKMFMPRFDKRITHWAFDIGPMRRQFQLAGVPFASMEGKTHRALDDARVHADEFRWYQTFISHHG